MPEIWSLGWRNPWRFSFDDLTGDMWIGDVGQDAWEEIDFESAGTTGGLNYGWRCYEGTYPYNTTGCNGDSIYTFPIFEYSHDFDTGGLSVTGGFVYRGNEFDNLYGYYVCADYVTGNFWTIYPDSAAGWIINRQDNVQTSISTFGEDVNGELYCANLDAGIIYHIRVDSVINNVPLPNKAEEIKIFPNPCSQNLNVQIQADGNYNNAEYIITDFIGRILLKDVINLNVGVNALQLNLNEIADGNYFITIKHNELRWRSNFTVVK